MPDLVPSKHFGKAFKALPKNEQKQVGRALLKLQGDPHHNSLRTKKVKALDHVFESRASDSLRILSKYHDGKILLLLVGGHELVDF